MGLPLIGAGLQLGGAIIQGVKGRQQARQAEQLRKQRDNAFNAIALEDPRQLAVLEETRRRRRAFETGTAFQTELRELRTSQAGTQQNILRAAGGAGGAAIAGLSRTQRATGRGIADLGRISQQAQLALTQQITAQTNLIAKRKTQLQTIRFSQLSAETAQKEREANANKNAALASAVSVGGTLLSAGLADLLDDKEDIISLTPAVGGASDLGSALKSGSQTLAQKTGVGASVGSAVGGMSGIGTKATTVGATALGESLRAGANTFSQDTDIFGSDLPIGVGNNHSRAIQMSFPSSNIPK